MCGIAGILNFDTSPDPSVLDRMLKAMVHRGPDDEGSLVEGPVALGMRRLSIIDLEGGHQPISNEDGSIWVVLNGEIYNYIELRNELVSKGHVFKTDADTEVLVHLYEEYGDEFPKRLNGMFGVAIWDARRRRLLLARDHLGIKPLYWAQVESRLVFASELRCLGLAGMSREINRESIAAYLHLGYIPRSQSPFRHARKLLPGWLLIAEEGLPPVSRSYWKLSDAYCVNPNVSREEAAEESARLIRDAVRLQLRSDVPVGTFLSGGIDSSSITAIASSCTPGIQTFGMGFEGHYFDETVYARQVAKSCRTRHHERKVDPGGLLDHLHVLSECMDEPNSDPALLPSYLICRHAREHVKVVLSGNGGDEVFGGYPRHLDPPPSSSAAQRMRNRIPPSMQKRIRALWPYKNERSRVRRFLTESDVVGLSYWVDLARPSMLNAVSPWASGFSILDWIEQVYAEVPGADWVNRRLYYDSTTYMPDQILNMLDRASMAVSLEVRVPLLDVRLVEFMASVAGPEKVRDGGSGKDILKLAMKGLLPDEIFTRRKLGFGMPLVNWIKSGPVREILQAIPSGRCAEAGFVEGAGLKACLNDHQALEDNWPFLWNLVMLELWMQKHARATIA